MKLNCIIVDDDPVFRVMLKKMVESDDERLQLRGIAESGEEAQQIFRQQPIDLIFLDIQMPGMSGFEFIEALENPDQVQIILVTGNKDHALDAFKYDVVDYLVKPITKNRFDQSVNKAVRNYTRVLQGQSVDTRIFNKLAKFMNSRDMQELTPVPIRSTKIGYAYPMLTANYSYEQEHKALELLDTAEQERLLTSEFVDSVYLCNNCYNSSLHIRETCPNCQSTHLEAEDLVHHFSCAYVGPLSDFYLKSDGEEMICPKCEKTLNHIGVDYDKPSLVYECQNCDQSFQNPEVKGKCHDCGADTKVEHLVKKDICKYQLTKAGKQVGSGNFDADLNPDGRLDDIMDTDYLRRMLKKAVVQKKESRENSCLADIQFQNISELYEQVGQDKTIELIRELHQIIEQELNATDDVIFSNKATARILIYNSSLKEAKVRLKKIVEKLGELIRDNFDGFETEFSIQVQTVDTNQSVNAQLNALSQFNSNY